MNILRIFIGKHLEWNEEKSRKLKNERGVSFEDIEEAIENGNVLDYSPHPNQEKYPHQFLLVVEINSYTYGVPCVDDGEKIFFKTVYPSRKAKRKYL